MSPPLLVPSSPCLLSSGNLLRSRKSCGILWIDIPACISTVNLHIQHATNPGKLDAMLSSRATGMKVMLACTNSKAAVTKPPCHKSVHDA